MACQTFPPAPYQVCGAILDKYNELGGPSGFLLWPTSDELTNPDGVGKRSVFMNGPIYWHPDAGAHPVANHFFACWQRNGWEAGPLRYPTSDELVNPDGLGRRQYFQGGTIYWKLNDAYFVAGAIRDKWGETSWETGYLGYPDSDEVTTSDGAGRFNRFEHGMIYWHPDTGAHVVTGTVLDAWAAADYERGSYGYPVAEQASPDEGATVEQQFQHGSITAPGPVTVDLSNFMAYITHEQVLASAIAAAQAAAKPLIEVVRGALQEARDANSGAVGRDPADAVPVPAARRAGDVFYSDAAQGLEVPVIEKGAEYEHGHNGIYVTREDTVQALDPDRGVQLVPGADENRKLYNPTLMEVNTTDDMRTRAATYARTRIGSGYNSDFAFNRRDWKDGEVGTYNCSQLVWAAYMNASDGGIDLDANGWWGVWPMDIRDSDWVTHYTA